MIETADESPKTTPPEHFRGDRQAFHLFAGAVAPFVPMWASIAVGRGGPSVTYRQFEHHVPVSEFASVFLGSHVFWMFAPFCLASMACFVAVLWDWKRAKHWYLRLGVYGGAVLGMMFSVAIGMAMGDFNLPGAGLSFSLGLSISKGWLAPLVVAFFYGIYFLHHGLKRRHRYAHVVMWWLLLGMPCLGMVLKGVTTGNVGAVYAPILLVLPMATIASAPLVALSYGLMSWHLIRAYEWQKPIHSSVSAAVWLSGLGMTLRAAFHRSVQIYESLPTEYGNCYVATAAARGSPWLVGSDENGVTDQLRFLKAFEFLLILAFPRFHRLLRKIYNFAGPKLAKMIAKRVWLANCAYFSLKPAEFAARLALRVLGGDATAAAKRLHSRR